MKRITNISQSQLENPNEHQPYQGLYGERNHLVG